MNQSKARLEKGGSLSLKILGTKKKASWSSTNSSIASVSSSGRVKAKRIGKATITARLFGKTYRCTLRVVKHKHTVVIDPKIKATAANTGWTKGSHCSTCKKVFVKRKKVKAKCICFGDSYSKGAKDTAGITKGEGWAYYLRKYTKMDVKVYGNHRAGFARKNPNSVPYPNLTFPDVLEKAAKQMTAAERQEITYVVCAGGYNDHNVTNTATIRKAVEKFCDAAKKAFPNAKIYIIPLSANGGLVRPTSSGNDSSRINAYKAIFEGAKNKKCVTCFSSIWWIYGMNEMADQDMIHPNAAGYKIQGKRIAKIMKGGSARFTYKGGGVTYNRNLLDTNASSLTAIQSSGTVSITGNLKVNGMPGSDDSLCSLSGYLCPGTAAYIPCTFTLSDGSLLTGQLKLDHNGKLTMDTDAVPSSEQMSNFEITISHQFKAGM